jgi:hypothetical protein
LPPRLKAELRSAGATPLRLKAASAVQWHTPPPRCQFPQIEERRLKAVAHRSKRLSLLDIELVFQCDEIFRYHHQIVLKEKLSVDV